MSETTSAQRRVEAVWRGESARIVSALTRHTGDFAWAEDLAQDALVEALARWPESGIPDKPGAWLLTVAKRRATDGWRRRERLSARIGVLGTDVVHGERVDGVADSVDPDDIDDDVLRLIFISCHPVLPIHAQLALTLRTVAGLTTEQIARALLVEVPAVQQRIVRAKRSLADAAVAFEVPDRRERPARIASVLQVIYLLFSEGYAATDGSSSIRPDVAREAVRLARQLAAVTPDEVEVQALIALMEFQSSRFGARVDDEGLPVTLAEQDRRRWDRSAIARGNAALARVAASERGFGYYGLQAAIAQCHAGAPSADDTDWKRIVALYDALTQISPTAVVRLNRAVALPLVDELSAELAGFRPLHAVRAELLDQLGEKDAAANAFRIAAALPGNVAERIVLERRADTAVSDQRSPNPD